MSSEFRGPGSKCNASSVAAAATCTGAPNSEPGTRNPELPPWVPAAVAQYGEARSWSDGLLDLTFAPVAGRTRLTHAAHRMPLLVQRVQYLDPVAPGTAFVALLSVGGGVLGGDRLTQRVRVEPGAAVHLTTQAATKLYRMERGYAATDTLLTVAAGAMLEYLPLPLIAQAGARWAGRTVIVVEPGATVMTGEVLVPGRLAMGEVGAFDAVALITEGRAEEDGEAIWRDALTLVPANLPSPPAATIGTLAAVTTAMPAPALAETLFVALDAECAAAGVFCGVSDLPGGAGVLIRLLGESRAVQTMHAAAWREVRRCVRGLGLPPLRRV